MQLSMCVLLCFNPCVLGNLHLLNCWATLAAEVAPHPCQPSSPVCFCPPFKSCTEFFSLETLIYSAMNAFFSSSLGPLESTACVSRFHCTASSESCVMSVVEGTYSLMLQEGWGWGARYCLRTRVLLTVHHKSALSSHVLCNILRLLYPTPWVENSAEWDASYCNGQD